MTGDVVGTLAFMPPEQALGKDVDARADIYAVGAMLYAAVTGRRPFERSSPADLLEAIQRFDPPPLASFDVDSDPAFEAVVAKALQKDPADRYQTAQAFEDALRAWLETSPLSRAVEQLTPGGIAVDVDENSRPRLRVLAPETMLGRYRLCERIGTGGLGDVFRAEDTVLGREVAVKVLRIARDETDAGLTSEGAARILREARASAGIDHENAVKVFDAAVLDEIPYLVLELVPGHTLREVIGDGDVPVERKVGWLIDIARALAAAHEQGVVHQDVKPENVMIRDDDGAVKVLDFGIARRLFETDNATADGTERIPGTPAYMAPEQMKGAKGDALSDQFSWAVVAFELLTGALPWQQHGGALHVVHEILTRTPDAPSRRRSDVPAEIDRVILRALAKKPGDRYSSMAAVAKALDTAFEEATLGPRRRRSWAPALRRGRGDGLGRGRVDHCNASDVGQRNRARCCPRRGVRAGR